MKTLEEIKREFQAASPEEYEALLEVYRSDERAGVRRLVESGEKKLEKLCMERERLEGMRRYEREYASLGLICGIDEAGRGPLAGPVVAGAVILPENCEILYLNDSKKLSAKRRDQLYDEIIAKAVSYGVGIVSNEVIDERNILQATYEAMRIAVRQLKRKPDVLLNDAVRIPDVEVARQVPIVKGDAKSVSIAAASVLAKVTRDRIMEEYDVTYPGYGFASNKGYGSQEHLEALGRLGPCEIHRRSFLTTEKIRAYLAP